MRCVINDEHTHIYAVRRYSKCRVTLQLVQFPRWAAGISEKVEEGLVFLIVWVCSRPKPGRLQKETCASGQAISEQRRLNWLENKQNLWNRSDLLKSQCRAAEMTEQRGHAENRLHHQHSWQWENSLDWQQISRSGKMHSAASQVHMQTWRKLKCRAEPAGCSRGWAHCQAAATGGARLSSHPLMTWATLDWLILFIRKGEVDYTLWK